MSFNALMKSLTRVNCIILTVGVALFVLTLGDVLALSKPVYDYGYVLENGIKEGERIEGEIYYSYGSFASKSSTTTVSGIKVSSNLDGYYYAIPVGESGMVAMYVDKSRKAEMDRLTDATDRYLSDGTPIKRGVTVSGRAHKMSKDLQSLFQSALEEAEYTKAEINQMIADTGGKYLVIQQYNADTTRILFSASLVITTVGFVLVVLRYRKEKEQEDWLA